MRYREAMKAFPIPALVLALGLAGPAFAVPRAAQTPSSDRVAALIAQANDAEGRGETELALRLAQSAIVADPARTAPYIALGDIYADTGEKNYARSYYDEALSIDPDDASALKAIATLDQKKPRVLAKP
jgi:Tfp pilus assembly protein PilF